VQPQVTCSSWHLLAPRNYNDLLVVISDIRLLALIHYPHKLDNELSTNKDGAINAQACSSTSIPFP
jgi:hypothetical protein